MRLLSDAQVAEFIRRGVLLLPLDELDAGLHKRIYDASIRLRDDARAQGDAAARRDVIGDDNVEHIPELAEVLGAPTLSGALTGLLGDEWVLHPHRFMHAASRSDQGWHKDSGLPWGQRKMRSHRPNWLIVMYYPQETTLEMGPTGVLSGTQYWTVDHEDVARPRGEDVLDPDFGGNEDDLELRDRRIAGSTESLEPSVSPESLLCPAGTVAVLHFDLFHRAMRRAGGSEPRRFAFKFWYGRATEPRRPTWEHRADAFAHIDVGDGLACLWQDVWDWMRGRSARHSVVPVDAATLARELRGDSEPERIAAAYLLGRRARGAPSEAAELGCALFDERESVRRAATYGLVAAGHAGVTSLVAALRSTSASTRKHAALGLGEVAPVRVEVVDGLAALLGEEQPLLRSTAAAALGRVGRRAVAAGERALCERVAGALLPVLDRVREPGAPDALGLERSIVRETACFALLELRDSGGEAVGAGLARARTDPDRYVAGLAAEGLSRLGA